MQSALKSTNMAIPHQKSKPKNTSAATSIMQSKKALQAASKTSVQNQKPPTAGPSSKTAQVIDDDDVICID